MSDTKAKNTTPADTDADAAAKAAELAAQAEAAKAAREKIDADAAAAAKEREPVKSDDLTTTRVLMGFTSYGPKGKFVFKPGMPIKDSDKTDYFPNQEAFRNRMKHKFIGLPA